MVVSANIDRPLITEYSDNEDLHVKSESLSDEGVLDIRNVPEGTTIYYDALRCADEPIKPMEVPDGIETSMSPDEYREDAIAFISNIRSQGLSLTSSRSYISSPVTYIQNHYSGYTYTRVSYKNISGVPAYYINATNACVEYGTAAILKYYLGSSYSYNTIANRCKSIAVSSNYATTSNYYIQNGMTSTFVRECINYYALGKTASSTLVLSKAIIEINNNRPCLLNIASSNPYSDHAVTAYGYAVYNLTRTSDNYQKSITFYKLRDGYTSNNSTNRYVCNDSITGVYVTKVY